MSWADGEHMQTEFGLTALQAAVVGLREYRPGGGIKSATLGLSGQRYFGRRWSLFGTIEAEHYLGDAADSPLLADIGTDLTFEVLAGVYFRF